MYTRSSTGLLQSLVSGPSIRDDAFPQPPDASRKALDRQPRLRPASSLANLIQFARNPVENVSEALENWYDGSTKEERVSRQALEDRKQLLYLKMRLVRKCPGAPSITSRPAHTKIH